MEASARACANIALAKYWGKSDVKRNVPAVPSISLTLDQLVTETRPLDEVCAHVDRNGDEEIVGNLTLVEGHELALVGIHALDVEFGKK